MSAYDGPIIDAHHHFWEPELGKQPWLLPNASIPFRYGAYNTIKKSYLPPDLLRDAEGFNVVGTVTMETEWDLADPVGEMRYTQHLADRFGLPNAAVAHAMLRNADVENTLAELSEQPLVRGVRNKPGQATSPERAKAEPTQLVDDQWRRGYALLHRYGLSFDLQVAWWHMIEARELVEAFPQTLCIINHAGLPSDRSPQALAAWSDNIRLMAGAPNVAIKISGIGVPGVAWTAENNRYIVETIAENFGPDRIMFASNFPVDSLCGTYHDIMGGFVELTKNWSRDEQHAAFAGNAVRIYRLDPGILAS